jgi:protein ImuA
MTEAGLEQNKNISTPADPMLPNTSLDELRARIRAIEGSGPALAREAARLGSVLDTGLPWGGLPYGSLHEVSGTAALRVVAGFAHRLLERPGVLVWCVACQAEEARGLPYGPGLQAFGLVSERLILVRCVDEGEVAWAAETALRSPAATCAIAELDRLDLVTSRRLQLAAEAGGGAGLLLRGGEEAEPTPNAALTRWRATGLVLPGDCSAGRPIRLDLWRAKGAASPASWTVLWNERTLAFDPAPGLALGADGARSPPGGQAVAGRWPAVGAGGA